MDKAKEIPIIARKHPIKINDFLSFSELDAKFNKENITVTPTVIKRIAIARETSGETDPKSPPLAAILISSSPIPIILNKNIAPSRPNTALIILTIV